MTVNRQTASYIMHRLRESGLEPDKRKGQNFLIDLNLLRMLINTADIQPTDVILEVGAGLGSLTTTMAQQAAAVVSVELDEHLYLIASEELVAFSNVTLLHQDALRNKNNIHPNVLNAVREQLAAIPGSRFKLVANLPYSIATPLISNLLSTDITPVSMTVTIQKELADRITARPRTKDYSGLSVWVQSLCDAQTIRVMPPEVFWPRPKVHSAIVHIVPNAEKRNSIPDLEFFHTFVRSLFFHRRKFLRSVLIAAMKEKLDKPAVDDVLATLGVGPQVRAEELQVEEIKGLSEAFRQRLLSQGLA